MPIFDHVAVKSSDVAAGAERYRKLGFNVEASFAEWGMVRDAHGIGIALLGPGSHHPVHFAMRVESLDELKRTADSEGRELIHDRDRTISFYTRGADGLALEFIWYPAKTDY